MKKLVSVFLAVVLVMGLVGCGQTGETNESDGSAAEAAKVTYPSETLISVVPFNVGGTADLIARAVANEGEEHFGKPMVVTNKVGAGGSVALTEFLKEQPNGHSIQLVGINQFALKPFVSEVQYKWEDFEPVIGIISQQFVLLAKSGEGIDNLDDLLDLGKNDTIKYATDGEGLLLHLMQSALYNEAGVNAENIVYNSAVEGMNQLLGGHVDVCVTEVSLAKEHIKSGALVPLTVFSEDDYTGYEGITVPSSKGLGYDIVISGDLFFVVRAGTDDEVIDTLYEGIAKIYEDEDFKNFMGELGKEANPINRDQLNEKVEKQIETIGKFLEENK